MTGLNSSMGFFVVAIAVAILAFLSSGTMRAVILASFDRARRPRQRLRYALLAFALVLLPTFAHAAATFGDTTVTYFDSGVTLIESKVGGQVYVYLVLTSAETSTLRGIYGDVRTATTGSTGTEPVDDTPTLPSSAPHLGDLTD